MHRRPSQSFERSNISCRRNLLFYRLRFSPNSDRICTESNLHVFCSKRYTGSVSISIETSAKSKIRIHSEYPGPRNKDARDVSSDLPYTTVSCPYEGRAMDPSNNNNNNNNRPNFVTTYTGCHKYLPRIIHQNWQTVRENFELCRRLGDDPPRMAYRRGVNIADKLVKARL